MLLTYSLPEHRHIETIPREIERETVVVSGLRIAQFHQVAMVFQRAFTIVDLIVSIQIGKDQVAGFIAKFAS